MLNLLFHIFNAFKWVRGEAAFMKGNQFIFYEYRQYLIAATISSQRQ